MNIDINLTTIISLVSLGVTVFVAYTASQMKLEIANLKIWMYEKFEQKKFDTDQK